MLGPTHRVLGALSGIGAAELAGQSWEMVVMSGLVATATSHGWASPDVDQTEPWVWVRKRVRWRMLNHRELTHWWGLPLLAAFWLPYLPPDAAWPATTLLVGWSSHLVGDLVFGDLPLLPGRRVRLGLGLDTGGFLETGRFRSWTVIPFGPVRVLIAAAIVWLLIGAPR